MGADFRYQYKCSITKSTVTYDTNGDPVAANEVVEFYADYQPEQKEVLVDQNGDKIPITFKLYIKPSDDAVVSGNVSNLPITVHDIENITGTIIRVFRTRLNTEVWVK